MGKLLRILLIGLIRIYQGVLSPLLGPKCRYTPSCSEYGILAIKKYGPWKGGKMALKRIASCRPGGGHGYDPVP